jgi:hypothetical protein
MPEIMHKRSSFISKAWKSAIIMRAGDLTKQKKPHRNASGNNIKVADMSFNLIFVISLVEQWNEIVLEIMQKSFNI